MAEAEVLGLDDMPLDGRGPLRLRNDGVELSRRFRCPGRRGRAGRVTSARLGMRRALRQAVSP
jgi:hypothetical protein